MAVLYDQFGREVQVKKRPETREIAVVTIRDRWSGYPSQGLTPQKLATIFKEADGGDIYRQAEMFEEMEEKDTHLFSQLQTRKNAVLGLEYEVQAASESAEDKKIRDFVSDVIFGLENFDDALLDLLDAIGKGFSLEEIMWGVDGNRVVIEGLQWIHPKKATFYEFGTGVWEKCLEVPRILTEAEPSKGEIMPPFKLIYHRYKARSGYDTRAGVLRVCAWMYLFKNYAIKDWVAFAEIFGMPLRLGKYDPGVTKDDKDALVAAIQGLGSDAAGIISKATEIEFVETVKSAGKDNLYEALASFCNKEQSKAILGQTLTTQEGKSGSYSLGQVHDLVRHDLIKADAKALGKALKFQLVRPLVGYNFGWDKPLPSVKFPFEAPEDLKSLSEVYKNLHEINQPISAEHVSERFKVPMPRDGEAVLAGPSRSTASRPFQSNSAVAAAADSAKVATTAGLAKSARIVAKSALYSPEQEKIEGLVADTADQGTRALSGVLGPVADMVLKASSLEEIRDKLFQTYSEMDPAELEDLVARAMYTAELYGRATVVKKNA